MLTKKSDGNISCCFDRFEIHPIVAIYGFLWYLNSLYGIILMIIEYHSECFFEWCGVCIVNATIPVIWLIIISMVDSCCIKYWSLKKWHRRHYGAAFLYFAIFTNQLLIFGTLCFYGFSVWNTIASTACNASQHLLYGFIVLISTSTVLILWIGLYQFYAATKYLCTYTAVLDVKRRQENSTMGLRQKNGGKHIKNGSKGKLMRKLKSNNRKHRNSLESSSVNLSTMSFSYIHTIYRYGEEPPVVHTENVDEAQHSKHETNKLTHTNVLDLNVNIAHIPQKRDYIDDDGNIATLYPPLPPPPRPISPQISDIHIGKITPLPSEHAESAELMEFNTEEQRMHDIVIETKLSEDEEDDDDGEFESKEMSEEESESKTPSRSTTHIVIAGIVIPTRKFTKIGPGKNKKHDHKRYKSVKKQEDQSEQKDLEQSELTIEVKEGKEEREINNLFSLPLIGRAIRITSNYFDRLKEDPSTADLCIICYDSFKNDEYLAKLKCGHVFHKNCIRIWLANNHSCPLCMFDEKNLNLKFYALNLNKNI